MLQYNHSFANRDGNMIIPRLSHIVKASYVAWFAACRTSPFSPHSHSVTLNCQEWDWDLHSVWATSGKEYLGNFTLEQSAGLFPADCNRQGMLLCEHQGTAGDSGAIYADSHTARPSYKAATCCAFDRWFSPSWYTVRRKALFSGFK